MKLFGFILIAAGFLGGSYLTSLDPKLVDWNYFLPMLVVGIAGVVIVRMGNKQAAQESGKVSENLGVIDSSIANLVKNVSQLNRYKDNIHTYDMHKKIDALLLEDLDAFAEARETIAHVHGLANYADVMNHFAGGERYLNRVWSASADGYIDEVNEYIGRAQEQFEEVQKLLNKFAGK